MARGIHIDGVARGQQRGNDQLAFWQDDFGRGHIRPGRGRADDFVPRRLGRGH